MRDKKKWEKWEQIACLMKAIAHPVRLAILDELCHGPKCVSDVQQIVDVSQPNLSQHLAALKKVNLIGSHIKGPMRCYYLLNTAFVKNLIEEFKKNRPLKERSRESVIQEVCKNKMSTMKS